MANLGFFPPFPLRTEKWLRHLFITEKEESDHMKVGTFIHKKLAGRQHTKSVPVPGSKTGERYVVSEEICRLCTKELVVFVYISGWTFRGDISMEDLYMTRLGKLRISIRKWNSFVLGDKWGTRLDTQAAAHLTRTGIFQGCVLPGDVDHLLRLMDDFNGNYKLLLYHPGLRHEVGKLAQYEILYMRLLQLNKLGSPKYLRIIGKVPYVDVDANHWKFRAEKNDYLQKVLMHKGGRNIRVRTSNRKAGPALNAQPQALPQGGQISRVKASKRKAAALNAQPQALPQGWINAEGLLISPTLLQQAQRTIAADPSLAQKLDPTLRSPVWPQGIAPPQPLQGPQADADRRAFYQMLLDYMGAPYDDDGSDLCSDARNSQVHVFMDNSVDPGAPAAPQPPAPQPAAPIVPPFVRIVYAQVEHMCGCALPGFYCDVFVAMAEEDEADTPEDESLMLMMASVV